MTSVRRLLPDPGETDPLEQVSRLDPAALAGDERPYLITNFVLSLDGRATIDGRSGKLGSDTDTAMLVALRTRVDAVMIGAGTMRAEGYGRVVSDPRKRAMRERDGLAPDPLMVIVSGRLDLPWDAPLFAADPGPVLIATASEVEPPETVSPVEILRQPDGVDLGALLRHLRTEAGVRSVLCEGGPRLHAQLIDEGLVDELFVTHAPKLVGGGGPGLVEGLGQAVHDLELAWLLHDPASGELFGRYRTRAR